MAASDDRTDDFILARLSDDQPILDGMAKLRRKYPNAMALEMPNRNTEGGGQRDFNLKQSTGQELFDSFSKAMRPDQPLTEAEEECVRQLWEELEKREQGAYHDSHLLRNEGLWPYAGTEIVDFRRLKDHKLFLIYGPTGSGKTTILDAICYALYGSTSGDIRTGSYMRSNMPRRTSRRRSRSALPSAGNTTASTAVRNSRLLKKEATA